MPGSATVPSVVIACGGTGGHLFPGFAVGEALRERGIRVTLFVSNKAIDQEASKAVRGMEVVTLDAVGLDWLRPWRFVGGVARSWRTVRAVFRAQRPDAVLAMGGFTCTAPLLAARRARVRTYLHESNAIPGRANRWFAPWVQTAFVGFPAAGARLRAPRVLVTGTPARPDFRPGDKAACRSALGLDPDRPTLLVTGGSQGASGMNQLVLETLPHLVASMPRLQVLHLAGSRDVERVRRFQAEKGIAGRAHAFLPEMARALGAADVAVSRAGAASLAEMAATQCPAVLVPFPAAVDDHQRFNAEAYASTGAALVVDQTMESPGSLAAKVLALFRDPDRVVAMKAALARWHRADAAVQIASVIVGESGQAAIPVTAARPETPGHTGLQRTLLASATGREGVR